MPHVENGHIHTVRAGDSTTSVAYRNGLFWESVWNHSKNAALKEKRKKANVLAAGDELFVPDKEEGSADCATEERHRFRRKGVPEKLNVRFLDLEGEPYANAKYRLRIDGVMSRGSLDGDGWLRVPIPPDARVAEIRLGETGEILTTNINIGGLDPISELTGVQARLRNLGFYKGSIDGSESERLDDAVKAFGARAGLTDGSGLDDNVRSKLLEAHGV